MSDVERRIPPKLNLCRNCHEFVKPEEVDCPWCGRNLIEGAVAFHKKRLKVEKALAELEDALSAAGLLEQP